MQLCYVFGDSIGQGIYLHESSGRYRRSRKNCIHLLQEAGIPIESHALMGCTIEKGLSFFHATEMTPGSNCVIEFGGNDCDLDWQAVSDQPDTFHDAKVPLHRFREELMRFIQEARNRQLCPILITPPPILSERYYRWVSRGKNAEHILQYLGDVEHISRWQERYDIAIRQMALQESCKVLDLRAAFLESRNLPALFSPDGIHPNEQGYSMAADWILGTLNKA